ncbi:MAG: MotA/TolQ/ExbB proton channel family protein [Thermoanaerobaculia bacterium]
MLLFLQVEPSSPSLFELFWSSGLTGKIVFLILAAMSVATWSIMLGKFFQLRKIAAQTREFMEVFRASQRFSEVSSAAARLSASPLVGLFQAGYAELDTQIKAAGHDPASGTYQIRSIESLRRSLRRAISVEQTVLSRGTAFLATTAAASPFIGLFGTVVGIMIAFRDIGVTGSTSLATVAPGIADALINTAAGLAAAIPALVGFNHFANRIRQMRVEMEDFLLEFINLAERNFT